MIKTVAIAVAASMAVASALPTFPLSWSSSQIQKMNINQGGVQNPDGSVCCPNTSPQCKVQTMYQPGIQYFDYENNRTAYMNPGGGGVVTLYNDGKEYAVDPSGACQSYCPLQDDDFGPGLGFGNNTEDMGAVTYNGVACTKFHWSEQMPILNITMQMTDFYVKVTGDTGIPIAQIDDLTPFGQKIGEENTTFVTFTSGTPAASHFTVTGKATCKIDQSCSGSSDDQPSMSKDFAIRRHMGFGRLEVIAI